MKVILLGNSSVQKYLQIVFLDQWENNWTSTKILYEMLHTYLVSTKNEKYVNLIGI